ncbi:MAG: hypothetical protein HUK40_04065 [Desulfobacter sp.]|nr:hypothetical protein [Desulfobacter sp.]WDP85063.1 MAG: hypothetical protein HUN05_07855 [Desulfobacter sp.]
MPEFESSRKLCDFAGNIGYFSFAFMQANENLRAHIYDLPEVCDLAWKLKKDQPHFDRSTFHDFDMEKDTSFGSGYDLFFSSHFLYELNADNRLLDFFNQVNQAMIPGGLFISNHIVPPEDNAPHLTFAIVELLTRCMGYPTHRLPEQDIITALSNAGFGKFTTKRIETEFTYPILLLSAVKIRD